MTTGLDHPATTRARLRREYVTDVVDRTESESAAYIAATTPGRVIFKTTVILIASALTLTIIAFFRNGAEPGWLLTTLRAGGLDGTAADVADGLTSVGNVPFNRLTMWAVVSVVGYVLLPVLAVKVVLRERLRDYGTHFSGTLRGWRPYVLLFAVSVPFVVVASFRTGFQVRYPFYDLGASEAWWPYLWAWWGLYAAQFIALEFFFRGFMVHGLKLRLGITAVLVMVVPYTMIHFNKPMLEALAAIVGGTVLGFLSLKTGSVWWGAALHIAIAAAMDLLALGQAGFL